MATAEDHTPAERPTHQARQDLLEREEKAKERAEHNLLWNFVVNGFSSFAVFSTHLVSVRRRLCVRRKEELG